MQRRPVRPLWRDELEEWLAGWWPLLLIVPVGGLLWLGFLSDRLGAVEAKVLLIGFPIAALLAGAVSLQRLRGAALGLGLAALLLAAVTAEVRIVQTIAPPAPFARVELSDETRAATVPVPEHVERMHLTVHAELAASTGSESYRLIVTRAGHREHLEGELSRQVQQGRSGRGAPSRSVSVHLTDRHQVTLPGAGPVELRLESLEGSLARSLRVAMARPPSHVRLIEHGMGIAILLGAIATAVAAQRRRRVHVAPAIGAALLFSRTVAQSFNPDSPLTFTLGALLLGALGGGAAGWLLGAFVGAVFRRRSGGA